MSALGSFHRIRDIRRLWPHEAQDFTPWLASQVTLLSEALGLGPEGLTVQDTEVPVGAFSADIVAIDTTRQTDETVLIENQYGRSDHDHFGKLLTYASGLKATTVVLICEKLREEHRTALTWLNTITTDDHRFFAVELELWRIDDSAPAPRFNVVVQPDDWARMAATTKKAEASGALTELKKSYLQYWGEFREYVSGMVEVIDDLPLRPRKPLPQQWTGFSIGKSGIELNAGLNTQRQWIKMELTLNGPKARAWFVALASQKDVIETEIGYPLNWEELSGTQQRIAVYHPNQDPTDRDSWKKQHAWLYDRLREFHSVFSPRVKALS